MQILTAISNPTNPTMTNTRYNDNVMEFARAIHFELEAIPNSDYCLMLIKYALKYELDDKMQQDVTRCYSLVYQNT